VRQIRGLGILVASVLGAGALVGAMAVGADGARAFTNNRATGWGTLTLNESHLHHNPGGQFQTFPGIYDNIDGHDGPPVMIDSTDS
jgi:hypothetical protein